MVACSPWHPWHLHILLQNVWLVHAEVSSTHTSLFSACSPCTMAIQALIHLLPVCVCVCFATSTKASSHSPLLCVTCQPWYPHILLHSLRLWKLTSTASIHFPTVHVLMITMTTVASCSIVCGLFIMLIMAFIYPPSLCMWPVHHGNCGIYTSLFPVCGFFTMITLAPYMHSFVVCGNNDILQCVWALQQVYSMKRLKHSEYLRPCRAYSRTT